MAIERTLSIIKPDGLEKGIIGKIIARFEEKGLKPVAIRLQQLSQQEAEGFYAVHKARPFFKDLVTLHDLRPGGADGARGRERRREEPRDHGRHQPGQRRPGHHPQGLRHQHRQEHGPRLGQPGEREDRDRVLLPRDGDHPYTSKR